MLVSLGALLVVIGAIVIRKYSPKQAQTAEAITLALVLYDIVVDLLFILSLGREASSDSSFHGLFVSMIVFTLGPVFVNIVMIIYVLYQLKLRPEHEVKVFYEWRQQNNSVFAFFILLGGTNIDALNVLSSRLLGLGMFSAPWGDNTKRTLNVLGLVGLVLEE